MKFPTNASDKSKLPLRLSFNVLQIDPTKISLDITVLSPSIVWCGAWKVGDAIDVADLQRRVSGVRIRSACLVLVSHIGRKTYSISDLDPSTTYEIMCTSHGLLAKDDEPIIKKQVVITKTGRFVLQSGYVRSDEVYFWVDSNLDIPFHCSLFNGKGIEVNAKNFNATLKYCSFPVFKPDSVFRVQCVAQHTDGRSDPASCNSFLVFFKSNAIRIEQTNYTVIHWIVIILIILIVLVIGIVFIFWR